jgi:type II secretory pathway component PulM
MVDTQNIEMTPRQKEIMLRGLRYVYSAIALDVYDPTSESKEERKNQLNEVRELTSILTGTDCTNIYER